MSSPSLLSNFASEIRSPLGGEIVYKDECVFCFHTPDSTDGILVCMKTFLGFCKKHVAYYFDNTKNSLFLQIKQSRRKVSQATDVVGNGEPAAKKPTRLAINVEGGFQVGASGVKYEVIEDVAFVILPDFTVISYPQPDIPEMIEISAAAILAADSASTVAQAAALSGTWEGDKRQISKYTENLLQLDNGAKIPPKGWKCQHENCELTQNLWLNLTDGSILCGRRFWDGTGGNNHAVDHYAKTNYPLAVKLGTITPSGADVYSYGEDDMVEDPYLDQHLQHFGISITSMEKTEKSMLELEIEYQSKIGEWSTLQESDCDLVPLFGPGYTGLANLGNTCYINSIMQTCFSIPEFKKKYVDTSEEFFRSYPNQPVSNFNVQMSKLGAALLSGDYSNPNEDIESEESKKWQQGVRANMFKLVIGKNHPEFSTNRQQDASEFLSHLINLIERNSLGDTNVTECFKFQYEDRFECLASHKVNYVYRSEYQLELAIPLDAATNKEAVAEYEVKKKDAESRGEKLKDEDTVRPEIPLSACFQHLISPQNISDFYSTATKAKGVAEKTARLKTFPDYLLIHLHKYIVGDDWLPKKLDVSMDIPDELDLEFMRGTGLKDGEVTLDPDTRKTSNPDGDEETGRQDLEALINDELVNQLADMGFHIEGCKKAVYFTKNTGIEAAMEWVMTHMNDADFEAPLQVKQTKKSEPQPAEEDIAMIMSLGFTKGQSVKALRATNLDVARAGDWAFSHMDELTAVTEPMDTSEGAATPSSSSQPVPTSHVVDGPARYKLRAFISHMGSSTLCGHYVCHIYKDGHWVIYNDEKVAESQKPPKHLAYIYLYERCV